jgi:hypothetical protein
MGLVHYVDGMNGAECHFIKFFFSASGITFLSSTLTQLLDACTRSHLHTRSTIIVLRCSALENCSEPDTGFRKHSMILSTHRR